MRGFAALHLLAMYLGVVAVLPGLCVQERLQHDVKHTLRLLGLWAPRPAAMLPVLVAMLLVRRVRHLPSLSNARTKHNQLACFTAFMHTLTVLQIQADGDNQYIRISNTVC